ncbi:chloroplastic mitochondrial [Micractinium conductrix]|uniref:Chloroplastic mitochondrial n=1 Tax=Micractinium conductrix TaxID=554055 RepID=A0A2P6VR56_9CHLO|nr:chloroplastic mitochondrial [Micractinium conductrix]|eukprot:PSC76578.1 chloroplastic mitochondrial [Micractinium conductrix]
MSHFAMGVRLASAVRQCSPAAARWAGGVAARLPLAGRPAQLLVVRASSSMDNNISSGLMESMRGKIQAALDAQMVTVEDMQGDGRHVEIVVVSKEFEGKSAVNRQRMVYKAIWEELQETVHAVDAMVTRTPEEAGM